MVKHKYPELPGCKPKELKFKDVPLTNGAGKELVKCAACEGSGFVCSASRLITPNGPAAQPYQETKDFSGIHHNAYLRKGWNVTSNKCFQCSGAGLHIKKGL